jgi:hypothetical protein
MQWLVQHGLITEDREWLTERGRRALERLMDTTSEIAERVMTILGKSDEDLVRDLVSRRVDLYLADQVATGMLIRLDNDAFIAPEHFDHSIHKRAENIRLLEMTRADIESFIAADDDDGRRYHWLVATPVGRRIDRLARKGLASHMAARARIPRTQRAWLQMDRKSHPKQKARRQAAAAPRAFFIRARKDRSETAMSVGATIRRWGLRIVGVIAGPRERADQTEPNDAWGAFVEDLQNTDPPKSKQRVTCSRTPHTPPANTERERQ